MINLNRLGATLIIAAFLGFGIAVALNSNLIAICSVGLLGVAALCAFIEIGISIICAARNIYHGGKRNTYAFISFIFGTIIILGWASIVGLIIWSILIQRW